MGGRETGGVGELSGQLPDRSKEMLEGLPGEDQTYQKCQRGTLPRPFPMGRGCIRWDRHVDTKGGQVWLCSQQHWSSLVWLR